MQLESGLEGEGRMECGGVAGRKRKARVQRRKERGGFFRRGEREREREICFKSATSLPRFVSLVFQSTRCFRIHLWIHKTDNAA